MTGTSTAVIRAYADGYDMAKPALTCRQAAGHGFLRAAVHARLRTGVSAYSLCGVTHTTANQATMDEISGPLREPVMPWDALGCTSTAVVETIRRIHEAETVYLRQRHGDAARVGEPQLPVIPRGVHCADFEFSDARRVRGRKALDIEPDEVADLFVGRLVTMPRFPHAIYRGLQLAAERNGYRDTVRDGVDGFRIYSDLNARRRAASTESASQNRLSSASKSLSTNLDPFEVFGHYPTQQITAATPVILARGTDHAQLTACLTYPSPAAP